MFTVLPEPGRDGKPVGSPLAFSYCLIDDKPAPASKAAWPRLLTSHSWAVQLSNGPRSWAPGFQVASTSGKSPQHMLMLESRSLS